MQWNLTENIKENWILDEKNSNMRLHVWIWCEYGLKVDWKEGENWMWKEPSHPSCVSVNVCERSQSEASWSGFLLSETPPGCVSPLVNTPRAESSHHTKPEQIRCRVSSASAAESKAHHGAAGSRRAAGTHAAIACCAAVDGNDFCHMEAKDKLLLLLQVRGGRLTWPLPSCPGLWTRTRNMWLEEPLPEEKTEKGI